MIRRHDLWPFGVNPPIPHPHFVHLIHQLADQVKAKTGVAEGRDLTGWRENHFRIFDCVLEIVFAPHGAATIAQSGRFVAKLGAM
jgi:hypothetical protein